jgi:hypothetical protein
MHKHHDQRVKRLGTRILALGGEVATQYEVAPDARAIDLWFRPGEGHAAVRDKQGVLGRMTDRDAVLEPYHDPPGLDDARSCIHKQLSLDLVRLAEARRTKQERRPAFPQLWMLSTGRAASVIDEYALAPMEGYPPGFYARRPADALGVIALREVPRTRDTLLLRMLATGAVLQEAIAELLRLPADAWEREVVLPELLAMRIDLTQHQDTMDEEEREFIMSTDALYEDLKQQYREEGIKESLLFMYQSRFGEPPREIVAAVEAVHDKATLRRWMTLVLSASPDEVAAAMRVEPTAS